VEIEKLRKFKTIVYLLLGILVFEIVMLGFMLYPGNMFIYTTLLFVLIICAYLAILAMGLIKELGKRNGK